MKSAQKHYNKVIKLLITIVLIGIISFICSKRWVVWFRNPVEPPYKSSNIPVRIQLTLGNDGQFSRNISWQCGDTITASHLLIVKSTANDTTMISAEGKIIHTQGGVTVSYHTKLTGLAEGEYSYSACTGGKQSAWYNFNVDTGDAFRFVYIGDVQDSIGGTVKNLFTSISQSKKKPVLWIFGGDVIERPHDRYWSEYFNSMDSITQTIPVIACPGNHEYRKGITGKLDERFIYTFSYFIDSRSNGHAIFDTRYGNAAIITLDSNRDTWTLFSQRRWFKQTLQKTQDAKWKMVVLHHPPYSIRGKLRHFFIRRLFDPLIREYGVDIVLQGHEHGYARMITKDKNNTLARPVYLISQASPKDYRINFDKKYDRFGNGTRYYQTIDISTDSLSLKAYTETGDLYDHVCIIKTDNNPQVFDWATGIPEHFDLNLSRNKKK